MKKHTPSSAGAMLFTLIDLQAIEKISPNVYKVTQLGLHYMDQAEKYKKNKSEAIISDTPKLAEEIRNYFPGGVKSGNLYVRSAQIDVENKLRTFFSKYPDYTSEQVKLAVSAYINACKQKRYAYMQTLNYFILKDQTSSLAGWIDNMQSNDINAEKEFRGEIV